MTDLRQSREYARFLKQEGWQCEIIGPGWAYFRKIPLTTFSIAKYQRPDRPDLEKFMALARKHRAVRVYFEPVLSPAAFTPGVGERLPRGWRLSRSPFLPTKTLQIDLAQPLAVIQKEMKKDARYAIRKAVSTSEVTELTPRRWKKPKAELFRKAWQRAYREKAATLCHLRFLSFLGFFSPNPPPTAKTLANLAGAFGDKAVFLVAVMNESHRKRTTPGESIRTPPGWKKSLPPGGGNILLGGAIILITDKTAYYYRAFTTREGRKSHAQSLIVWEAIRLAKKRGCRIFDFEGIFDPRFPVKNWQGFSHFKKSFGGKEVSYPGCFTAIPTRIKLGFD